MLKAIKDQIQGKCPPGAKRSPWWSKTRKKHLEMYPRCAVCGGTKTLEVHHVMPFHLDASLELDEKNLITLCEVKKEGITCHLFFGHLGNYKLANPDVRGDAEMWRSKMAVARQAFKALGIKMPDGLAVNLIPSAGACGHLVAMPDCSNCRLHPPTKVS